VVPLTSRLPDTVKSLLIVVVPVPAPTDKIVALVPKLSVVGVSNNKNDELLLSILLATVGLLLNNTVEPDPVVLLTCVPLIFNTLPVPAVSNVLFVKVSVVARPTSVSVDVGSVSVPVLTMVEKDGEDKVGDPLNTILPVPVAPVEVTPSNVG